MRFLFVTGTWKNRRLSNWFWYERPSQCQLLTRKEMKLHLILLVLNWCLPISKALPIPHPQWRQSRYIIDNRKKFLFKKPFIEMYNEEHNPVTAKISNFTEGITRKSIQVGNKDLSAKASDEENDHYQKYGLDSHPLKRTEIDDGAGVSAFEIQDHVNTELEYNPQNLVQIRNDQKFRVGSQSQKQVKVNSEQLTLITKDGENDFVSTMKETPFGVKAPVDSLSEKKVDESSSSLHRHGEFFDMKSNHFELESTTSSFSWNHKGEKTEKENKIEMHPKGSGRKIHGTISDYDSIDVTGEESKAKNSKNINQLMKEMKYVQDEKGYDEEMYYDEMEENYEREESIYKKEEQKRKEQEKNYEEQEKNYGEQEKNYEEQEKNYEEQEKNYEEQEMVYEQEEKNHKEENEEQEKNCRNSKPSIYFDRRVRIPTNHNDDDGNKFGYVVDGENYRKYRVEERTVDGFIVGEYGVVRHDDGSLRGVRYTADGATNPELIYKALIKFLSL